MTNIADKTVKGVLGKKLGMTQVWDADNRLVPVTVIEAGPCVFTQVRNADTDGYAAVQIAFGAIDPRKVTKPLTGHFEKAGVTPRRHLVELRTADAGEYSLGQELTAGTFEAGQAVDVSATTKGKGFAGGMKRWNFRGLEASHGVSVSHRSHGSTGNRQDPGKTFAGKKMAGHLGVERVTTLNLEIAGLDVERGLIMVRGAVPGSKGEFVRIRDAVKKARHADAPYPAGLVDAAPAAPEAPNAD